MKAAIGIDIGGTKIAVTLGTERGKILLREEFSTPLGSKVRQALPQISCIVDRFLMSAKSRKLKVGGIGVASPGAVDTHSGLIPYSPNMPGWKNFKIVKPLKQKHRLPVFLANDANAAACAEKVFGTAKKFTDFVYLTVSTGIGAGIFSNGRLVEGAGFSAGEVGHVLIVSNGNLCGCGRRGCFEAQCSGTAIGKIYSRETGRKFSAKEVSELARRKNKLALRVFEEAGDDLGKGLSVLMNVVNPALIILGGGVFKSAPKIFLKKAMQRCRQAAWPMAFDSCRVKESVLGGGAGDLGALALVFLKQK